MAISIGNTANSGATSGTSATFALNNNKEDVIVAVAIRDAEVAATASVTYGGEAMTADKTLLYEDGDSSSDLRVYIFRKTGALTGSNNVVVTLSNSGDAWGAWAIAVGGLSATGQPEITASASADFDAGSDPSTSMTTTTADCLLIDVVYNKSGTDMTASNGQTIVAQLGVNGGGDRALMGYKIVSSAGSQASTYAETSDDDWCMVSVAYKIMPSFVVSTKSSCLTTLGVS